MYVQFLQQHSFLNYNDDSPNKQKFQNLFFYKF